MSDPIRVVRPEDGRSIHWMGSRGTFLATAESTAGAYAFWVDHPLGQEGSASHVHTREEEFFYVVAGEVSYSCAGKTFEAKPGGFVGLPKGLGHRFRNDGIATAQLLIGLVPGGGEGFFLDLGNPYDEPHDASIPPDPARYGEVAARYGQILLKPNLLGQHPNPQDGDVPLGVGRAPTLREPGEGDAFAAAGVLLTLKAVGFQTLGSYALTEIELAPRAEFPAHRHARYAEGLYVLEGELTVNGDDAVVAAAGSFVPIPPGTAHSLTNATDRPTRVLSLTVPGGIEDFYRAACRPCSARPARPSAMPADAARLLALGPAFGVEFE